MADDSAERLGPECLLDERLLTLLQRGEQGVPPQVERHLSSCPRCQSRLDALSGLNSLPKTLPAPLPPNSTGPLSQLLSALRSGDVVGPEAKILGVEMLELSPSPVEGALGEFAGYVMLERVAEGGMGIVYRAYDPQLARVVAVKVLRPSMAHSETSRLRFVREARAAAAVVHEHVVSIHAVGEHRGLPFLVMSFIKGRSLERRMSESALSLTEILRVGTQTARGLAAAHAQGLIHRDIKPGNILLENSVERVKLVDFGLARAIEDTSLTQLGVVAGTPEYMAPEQVKGEGITSSVDQFSLGCVLYVLAAGQNPFRAETTLATLRRIVEVDPPPLHQLHPDRWPSWLGLLVQRLQAKTPEARFCSMSEVAELLEYCQREQQAGRTPMDPRLTPSSAVASRTSVLAWGGALMGLLLLGIMVWRMNPPRTPVIPPERVAESAPATQAPATFRIERGGGAPSLSFSNLTEAVTAAVAGDTIELPFTGEVSVTGLRIGKKALRLRAASGARPTLNLAAGERVMLYAEADLVLEGLELRAPGNGSDKILPGDIPATGLRSRSGRGDRMDVLVFVDTGRLTLRHCRLVGPTPPSTFNTLLALENCPEANVINSEFYNLGGVAVTWRRREIGVARGATNLDPARIQFTNSLLVVRDGVLLGGNSGPRCTWSFERCAVIGLGLYRTLTPGDHLLSLHNSALALRQALSFDVRRTGGMGEVPVECQRTVLVAAPQFADTAALRAKDPELLGPFSLEELVHRVRTRTTLGAKRMPTDYQTILSDFPDVAGADLEKLAERTPAWSWIGPGADGRPARKPLPEINQ